MAGDLVISTINGGAIGAKNAIINGNFGINQRGVSGTVVLSAGDYGHDRWKAGTSGCTYTFTTTNNVTTITITAGSLMQVIEGINLQSGTYTLSWTGTAQGQVDGGVYAGSGLTGTAVGGTNQTIEFNTGTLSLVQYEAGSVATPFEHRQYGQELALCQRYYQKSYDYETVPGTNTTVGSVTSRGDASSTMTQHALTTRFVVTMRAVPTMVLYSRSGTSGSVSDCGISATTENGTVSVSSLTGLGTNGLSCLSLSTAAGPSISMQYTAEAEL